MKTNEPKIPSLRIQVPETVWSAVRTSGSETAFEDALMELSFTLAQEPSESEASESQLCASGWRLRYRLDEGRGMAWVRAFERPRSHAQERSAA